MFVSQVSKSVVRRGKTIASYVSTASPREGFEIAIHREAPRVNLAPARGPSSKHDYKGVYGPERQEKGGIFQSNKHVSMKWVKTIL